MTLIRRWFVALVFAALLPSSAVAHPGSGIVVDRNGQVYFLDTGSGVWKIDSTGALVRMSSQRFHWLALDANDRFAAGRLPSGASGDILRAGSSPTLLIASDYPIAIGSDGELYYPARTAGGQAVDVLRYAPNGTSSVLANVPLPFLNGIAAAPHGALYYTENRAIRRIDERGRVTTVVERVALDVCPRIPGNDANDPLLRGLAVDSVGTVYVAASGCGSVLKVTPNGRITTILQLESPWSPTAVAVFGGSVYVLEYLHTEVEDRLLWLPRVRRITPDGKSAIIAAIRR